MALYELMKPDFEFEDERGALVQLVHEGYRQINVVSSKQGVVRGGHFHRHNREAFYVVSGSFELRLRLGEQRESRVFRAGEMFALPPGVIHEFAYLEDTLLIGLYDRGVEEADGKDIIAESL